MFDLIDGIASVLGTFITPLCLFISAAVMFPASGISNILNPVKFIKLVKEKKKNTDVSPFRALSVALAGTLGVGNITGVASALIAGGPGAVFWMWVGSAVVIAVKYSEVVLAVRYRRQDNGVFFGGAMYYIDTGLSDKLPSKFCRGLASLFAVLCCANSVITGNLVQSNAASSVIPDNHRVTAGCILSAAVLILWMGVTKYPLAEKTDRMVRIWRARMTDTANGYGSGSRRTELWNSSSMRCWNICCIMRRRGEI